MKIQHEMKKKPLQLTEEGIIPRRHIRTDKPANGEILRWKPQAKNPDNIH